MSAWFEALDDVGIAERNLPRSEADEEATLKKGTTATAGRQE
jgi:hypothetical protein